ncbi:MAG: sigma-54 dependent transcriptional regulator [Kofleriaceae bacterium]
MLVVDDEAIARKDLAELLHARGYEVETAADAFKALGKYATFLPQVVVTDLKLPGMGGIELAQAIRELEDPASVIVVTGFGEVTTAIEAMRAGVAEYLVKPINFGHLLSVLEKTVEQHKLRSESRQLRQRQHERYSTRNIVGDSPAMQRVFEVIDQIAPSSATVLLSGESGTGKELVAHAIHLRSNRASGPFVKVQCAALAESLLESELFGHERGSFTGAVTRKDGRFQIADGGTLFLDEIGEISPAIQVKLLRFLQEREFERVGGNQTIHVDVRVIVATNRRLAVEVAARRFREDLYYRLNVVALEMPALRERKSDIPLLAKFFLDRYARANTKTFEGFTPEALELLVRHDWPGNVRELENAIERAVIFAPGPLFEPSHLPPTVHAARPSTGMPPIPGATMAELARYAILETLRATSGSTSKAAEILGISARTIQYRLHEYSEAPHSDLDVVRKN